MYGGRIDLADVRALLSSGNPVVQSQGLTGLFSHLKPPFPNAKARASALSLLFDCFTLFDASVAQSCAEAVPYLVKSDVISTEEVVTECLLKLCTPGIADASVVILVRLLLLLSKCLTSTCFTILRKSKGCSGALIDELRTIDIERSLPALKALVYSDLLSQEETINLLSKIFASISPDDRSSEQFSEYLAHKYSRHIMGNVKSLRREMMMLNRSIELSNEEVLSLELCVEHTFAIVDNLLRCPELVMNESFPSNHVLLPSLFSLYSSRSELAKCVPGMVSNDHLTRIKTVVARSQAVHTFKGSLLQDEFDGSLSTFSYLGYTSAKGYLAPFLDLCNSKLDVTEVCERSVVFVTALVPYCDPSFLEKCFRLLSELVKRAPEVVNGLLLLFTTLYAKPYFKVDRSSILKAVGSVFVNRFAVTPAVNFLSIVCRQPGQERDIAFGLLGDLVTKFPTAFDVVKPLAIPADSDSLDLLKGKLNLMTTLCVATDRSDELLPSLSNLLKKDAPVVGAAVSVVKVLCKEDILDVDTVRKQLGSRVRQSGFEEPLAGYCEILATAASQKEQSEDNLVEECVKELWEITQIRRDSSPNIVNARKAAWTALAAFDALSVCSVVSQTPEGWMAIYAGLAQSERKGFTTFLQKLVADDLESLSRTLYTKDYVRKSSLSPFITNLHNSLRRTNQEAPWFWSATLPLYSVIVTEYAESGKGLQAIKLLRRVLREVHVVDDKIVNLFAGWRICIVSLLGVLTGTSDPIKARDQIVEECKRALTSTELSVNNVLIVLAILAGELKRFGNQIPNAQAATEFETTMRPWFVAVLEFMFPLVFSRYNQKSPPILQLHVNPRCVNKGVARSAVWLACLPISDDVKNFFEGDEIKEALKWRLGREIDRDGYLCKTLLGEEVPRSKNSLSVSKIWMFSAALGAQELITNSLSRSIPIDDSIEQAVKQFEAGAGGTEKDVLDFFMRISNLPLSVFRKYEKRLRKPLEQIFNKGGEQMKRAAYEGLSHLASVSLLTVAFDLPADYAHLPDDSILRAVIAQYGPKSICPKDALHDLLPVLVDHVRSDNRHLPPMEWQFMLLAIDYQSDDEARMNLLKLAFQQKDAQIIYELTSSDLLDESSCSSEYMVMVSKNLPMVLVMMPAVRAKSILQHLLKFSVGDDDAGPQILANIDACGKLQIVLDALVTQLPLLESSSDLLHKLLSLSCVDQRFNGQVSRCFDFWLGCNGRAETKLATLVDYYIEDSANSNVMLSIFGYCAMDLPLQQRLDKLIDVMSIGNVMLSLHRPIAHVAAVLNLVLALVCSVPADIPMNWLSPEVADLLYARWRYYWKKIIKKPEFCKLYDVITAFLFPCFLLEDLATPLANAVRGMLLYVLSSQPDIVRPYLEDKSTYWEKLLM
ncbi:hypothetical protein ANCCAN_17141 [Ancylostoma caninum]|uniref:Uncharacterized protein n=1 Tax=Ancylostoma caninum TaxID=29170 RepID=A0A368G1R9_ANCCA|nr:hypothetical protein ANCCAN_17141 [Ancylostoma caninum]